MESILEELAPRNSRHSRSHGRRRRGRFTQPTPRRLEYEEVTPGANLPPGAIISQGAYNAEGAPLAVAVPITQPWGLRRGTCNQSKNARPLAERLGITQDSLAMIVHMVGEEQRGHQGGQGAPLEQRKDAGTGRTYRGVRGWGRDRASTARGGHGPPTLIEYLPYQSKSSQHTPNQQSRRRTRPPNGHTGATLQNTPSTNPQSNPQQTIPIIRGGDMVCKTLKPIQTKPKL